MNICVFGSASEDIGEQYKKDTEAICKALAECGNNLVFGGGGTGLMGAAARGLPQVVAISTVSFQLLSLIRM